MAHSISFYFHITSAARHSAFAATFLSNAAASFHLLSAGRIGSRVALSSFLLCSMRITSGLLPLRFLRVMAAGYARLSSGDRRFGAAGRRAAGRRASNLPGGHPPFRPRALAVGGRRAPARAASPAGQPPGRARAVAAVVGRRRRPPAAGTVRHIGTVICVDAGTPPSPSTGHRPAGNLPPFQPASAGVRRPGAVCRRRRLVGPVAGHRAGIGPVGPGRHLPYRHHADSPLLPRRQAVRPERFSRRTPFPAFHFYLPPSSSSASARSINQSFFLYLH